MSFFIKKKQKEKDIRKDKNTKPTRKKVWRIVIMALVLLLITIISYGAFLVASGSKVFEQGLGGQSIIKTLYGNEKLKGEAEDRINILLMGMGGVNHPGGLLTDSIMVLSIRPSDKKVAILSIPRDLQVKIAGKGDDKINSAFSAGYNDYYAKQCNKKNALTCQDLALTAGAKQSADTVSTVLNIPIHYYITADFTGFEKIIDQLGGVDVYVEKAIYDPLFPDEAMRGYAPFKIKAGQQHLDGKTALKYARSRETTSDFDRAARQQKIVSAVRDKAMTAGFFTNPKKVADVTTTLGKSIKVSFTPSEIKTFIDMMSNISMSGAITEVLSNAPNGLLVDYNNGLYYLKPKSGNFKEIQNLALNIFDYKKKELAKIEIQNGATKSGLGGLLSEELQKANYMVSSVSISKQKTAKTVIYDLSGGSKKNTLEYLKNKLNAEIKTADRKTGEIADILIIIGDDYIPPKS
jgi:LCP family protein required for cell wall assembly